MKPSSQQQPRKWSWPWSRKLIGEFGLVLLLGFLGYWGMVAEAQPATGGMPEGIPGGTPGGVQFELQIGSDGHITDQVTQKPLGLGKNAPAVEVVDTPLGPAVRLDEGRALGGVAAAPFLPPFTIEIICKPQHWPLGGSGGFMQQFQYQKNGFRMGFIRGTGLVGFG